MSDPKLKAELRQIGIEQHGIQSNPDTGTPWSLGFCRVVDVSYEEFLVTLQTVGGTSGQYQRTPVPLVFPAAGSRHFLGAMPQVGDYCICGWVTQDSSGVGGKTGTRIPVILGWMPKGIWPGRDWLPVQDFSPDEHDSGLPRESSKTQGMFDRARHKLRHMQPGNIVASSGQGSDLVLDESVLLTNRRGNEIRLRDQDQAFVVRSIQQFHAMAGARIYGGIVQRDATLLGQTLVSDGLIWDSLKQFSADGKPLFAGALTGEQDPTSLYSEGLATNSKFPGGQLTPARILARPLKSDGTLLAPEFQQISTNLNPYSFLQQGLFIDQNGQAQVGSEIAYNAGSTYGGKRLYRIAQLNQADRTIHDGTTDTNINSFTEYRIEVAHTSDGTLPVTEQTDGLDADRLPSNTQDPALGKNTAQSKNNPYVQFVLGTVVGNDPYSPAGLKQYGLPLTPVIFRNGGISPSMESALGLELGEQAATLLSVQPLGSSQTPNTFLSIKKNGQLRAFLSGPSDGNSLELATTGNGLVNFGGTFTLRADKGLHIQTHEGDAQTNTALKLSAAKGAVVLYGGGKLRGPDTQIGAERQPGLQLGGDGVDISSNDFVSLKAAANIDINSPNLVDISGNQAIRIAGGQRATVIAEELFLHASGKQYTTVSGPLHSNPSNGALRETVLVTSSAGTADHYSIPLVGDRVEEINVGNHTTSIQVGNLTYQTAQGSHTIKAGTNQFVMDSTAGMSMQVTTGDVSIQTTGTTTISSNGSILLNSDAGSVVVRGNNGVYLSSPGGKVGGIVSGADIDPLTGLPLQVLGLGSTKHLLSAA